MSSKNPSSFTGAFTQGSLPDLLKSLAAERSSGQLTLTVNALSTGSSLGRLHFIQGKLAAAEFDGLGAVAAFQRLAASREGRYEFSEGFVQFSQLGIDKRIHQTLESLLALTVDASPSAPTSSAPLEGLNTPRLAATQPNQGVQRPGEGLPSQVDSLDAFDLDALNGQTMRSGYLEALTAMFVRSVGPAGYVLLEDIAQDTAIDLRELTPTQAVQLNRALLEQIPLAKRPPFQIACATYLEQFKPQ